MRKKEMKLIITFHTTADAMAMESLCKTRHIEGRLIPVPRSISAGCGLAWSTEESLEDAFRQLMLDEKLESEGIYHCMI